MLITAYSKNSTFMCEIHDTFNLQTGFNTVMDFWNLCINTNSEPCRNLFPTCCKLLVEEKGHSLQNHKNLHKLILFDS